jgi:hypothetical protein
MTARDEAGGRDGLSRRSVEVVVVWLEEGSWKIGAPELC